MKIRPSVMAHLVYLQPPHFDQVCKLRSYGTFLVCDFGPKMTSAIGCCLETAVRRTCV